MSLTTGVRRRVVLSPEQALSLPYVTSRLVQKGSRVIRIEATHARRTTGDPNRYISKRMAGDDRCSYFIAQNVGKEAISLDLKPPTGQEVLHRIIKALDHMIFVAVVASVVLLRPARVATRFLRGYCVAAALRQMLRRITLRGRLFVERATRTFNPTGEPPICVRLSARSAMYKNPEYFVLLSGSTLGIQES